VPGHDAPGQQRVIALRGDDRAPDGRLGVLLAPVVAGELAIPVQAVRGVTPPEFDLQPVGCQQAQVAVIAVELELERIDAVDHAPASQPGEVVEPRQGRAVVVAEQQAGVRPDRHLLRPDSQPVD
jgi:hypothetical protein